MIVTPSSSSIFPLQMGLRLRTFVLRLFGKSKI
ncbi:hypothetical protein LINPERPRIM_LOCUS3254 [Linum perenne]